MSDWTHAACVECFRGRYPEKEDPAVMRVPHRDRERCCFCGRDTDAGIYVREHPTVAPFHIGEAKS